MDYIALCQATPLPLVSNFNFGQNSEYIENVIQEATGKLGVERQYIENLLCTLNPDEIQVFRTILSSYDDVFSFEVIDFSTDDSEGMQEERYVLDGTMDKIVSSFKEDYGEVPFQTAKIARSKHFEVIMPMDENNIANGRLKASGLPEEIVFSETLKFAELAYIYNSAKGSNAGYFLEDKRIPIVISDRYRTAVIYDCNILKPATYIELTAGHFFGNYFQDSFLSSTFHEVHHFMMLFGFYLSGDEIGFVEAMAVLSQMSLDPNTSNLKSFYENGPINSQSYGYWGLLLVLMQNGIDLENYYFEEVNNRRGLTSTEDCETKSSSFSSRIQQLIDRHLISTGESIGALAQFHIGVLNSTGDINQGLFNFPRADFYTNYIGPQEIISEYPTSALINESYMSPNYLAARYYKVPDSFTNLAFLSDVLNKSEIYIVRTLVTPEGEIVASYSRVSSDSSDGVYNAQLNPKDQDEVYYLLIIRNVDE